MGLRQKWNKKDMSLEYIPFDAHSFNQVTFTEFEYQLFIHLDPRDRVRKKSNKFLAYAYQINKR